MKREERNVRVREVAIAFAMAIVDLLDDDRGEASDTFSKDTLPPFTKLRTLNEWCRSGRVKGARKVGRNWVCAREAWFEARSTRPAVVPPVLRLVAKSEEELAIEDLKAAGFRVTR